MSYDTKKTAADYWGTSPAAQQLQAQPPPDLSNLGPAPRELTPALRDYVKKSTRSLTGTWITVGAFFLLPALPMAAFGSPSGESYGMLLLPAAFFTAAYFTWRSTQARRAQLAAVLEQGDIHPAQIISIRAVEIRRGRYANTVRYHVVFLISGKHIEHVSHEAALAMLQVGLSIPVVWHPNLPDLIAPTFLL